jgi:hypothetical protein
MALFNFGVNTAIMAHVRDNVKKFFKIVKLAFRWFQRDWGDFYPVTNTVDNVTELQIKETGSTLAICTEAKGLTLDFLHISEASFVEDERISESLDAVPTSGWIILETTPNTASGMFYDIWDNVQRGNLSSFRCHFFPWWFHYPEEEDFKFLNKDPEKFQLSDKESALAGINQLSDEHILWRRLKITECGGDEGEFCRKYPEDPMSCFLAGSKSVFSDGIIARLFKNQKPPAFVGDLFVA